jgi:chitodextrinase
VKLVLPVGLAAWLTIGGCPLNEPAARYQSTIDVQIGVSTTAGAAPLQIFVSGEQSSSSRGSIASYAWDFAGEATAESMTAAHTFTRPGRYPITLTVVDPAGEQASARVYVRVSGGAVTAVITANRLSGPAPLGIQFDGSASTAVDDTVLDYHWDFGDNQESRLEAPFHLYRNPGTYTVQLRAVSAGGVEGYSEATVAVGAAAAGASLQFNGTQYATLPVSSAEPLAAFTFETWCRPDSLGGTLVNFGTPNLGIDVEPEVGITLRAGSTAQTLAASVTPGQWQHVALSYSSEAGATVYLGGAPAGTLPLTGEFSATLLSTGAGFHGKMGRVRFWSIARGAADIAAGVQGTLTGFEEGLLGDWPLSAGQGQILANNAADGDSGTRGASDADELADPAWSNDSP